ncbi:MAG: glycosyltransferase family 9 protein [Jatrophihabitans sp.]|uniref:glycosyltransferase family 9 protein n=1 Tax=Jatrophihabitans sp. TaxID=1932789 RepID=UPI003F7F86E8
MRHVLVVRPDSMGDVLICGPAVRAVAAHADRVTMMVSQRSARTAALLPGVDNVLVWDCPWITSPPPRVLVGEIMRVVRGVRRARVDEALILTSFHQSSLPTALMLRLAGVERIHGVSTDFPGTLLTTRLPDPPDAPDAPEPIRMLSLAQAAGFAPRLGDDQRLRVHDTGQPPEGTPRAPFVVVHPGTDAPARAYPEALWREVIAGLGQRGHTVVVTGSAGEADLCARVAGAATGPVVDLAGRTSVAELAAVLRAASVVVVANTGPAHLAAAVGAPIVSLFAPVVPAARWAPHGVPTVVLGDQDAACRATRVRDCHITGHPCLTSVEPAAVVEAAEGLARQLTREEVPA